MKHQHGMEMGFPEAHVRRDRAWRQRRAFGVPEELPHILLQKLTLQSSPPTVDKKSGEMGRGKFNN